MSSPYATVEPHEDLWFEQSNYIATHIASMCYGGQVAVFFTTVYRIFRWRVSAKKRVFWLSFLLLLLATATINLACSIRFNQHAWIDDRNYPGGPYAFLIEQQSRPIMTAGNTFSILGSFLADGILLYRVMVLWNFIWYIIIPPILFYIACVILSILTTVQIADPNLKHMINLSFPVWLVLMIINIVFSAMIAIRILAMQRDIKARLGDEYAKPYTTIASIIVEAALPFTILSIILLVLFGGHSTAQNLFVPLLVQVECLAPELIILRVIISREDEDEHEKPTSSLKFASSLRVGTESTWATTEKRAKKSDAVSEDLTMDRISIP